MVFVVDKSMHPPLKNNAVTIIMILGPILSFSLPIIIPNRPAIKNADADAPEISARGHPNSDIKGVKKTPNAIYIPTPTAWRPKQDEMIILE